jgi:hypothetical protein
LWQIKKLNWCLLRVVIDWNPIDGGRQALGKATLTGNGLIGFKVLTEINVYPNTPQEDPKETRRSAEGRRKENGCLGGVRVEFTEERLRVRARNDGRRRFFGLES